jgi:hypothetical protein
LAIAAEDRSRWQKSMEIPILLLPGLVHWSTTKGDHDMSVTVAVDAGPSFKVPWTAGMNAQNAMELAQQQTNNAALFTYALQYYGAKLGYLVLMINETYDSFISAAAPFFYWEFLVNGKASATGIDSTKVSDGDVLTFRFSVYDLTLHASTPLAAKHKLRTVSFAA